MVKTAVIGASGYVGRHLWEVYRSADPGCIGTTFSSTHPDLVPFDIRRPNLEALRLEETGHRAVLIASAKANISFCEREKEAAYEVNVRGMLELIRQIGRTSLQAIFLSSDYVFEGITGGYDDGDETRPTTEYGRQKVIVEKQLPALCENHLILRLSKIFGLEKGDRTLLDEIASCLASGREVRAATDQVFCPTYVGDLVRVIQSIQERGLRGALNVCSPEYRSRYDIAAALAKAMRSAPGLVKPVSLHDLSDMENRPLNASLRCSRLHREVGMTFTPFEECITRVAVNWR